MFTTKKMFLLDLLILQKHKDAVSEILVKAGLIEPSIHSYFAKNKGDWSNGGNSNSRKVISEFEKDITELDNYFSRYKDLKTPAKSTQSNNSLKATLSIPAIGDFIRQYRNRASFYSDRFNTLKTHKEDIAVKIAGLRMFTTADDETRKNFRNPENTFSVFGIIHNSNLPLLQYEFENFKGTLLNEGHVGESELLFITVSKDQEQKLRKLLDRVYFINHGLPEELFGKGEASMVRLGLEFTLIADEEDILYSQCVHEAVEILENLAQMKRAVSLYNKISDVTSSTRQNGQFVLITGWVVGSEIKKLRAAVEKICENKYELHVSDSDTFSIDNEVPPTQLSNPSIIKPFESLVTLFGVPHYKEIDPTPIVSALYVFMYGAMFGDIGQGAILFLAGITGLLFKKHPLRLIFSIMVWVGMSSIFFGFMYGSIFGYEDIIHHVWISPLKQTNLLLAYSIFFGIGVILLGFILGLINAIRMQDWSSLIFSHKGIFAFSIYIMLLTIAYFTFKGYSIPTLLYISLGISTIILGLERVWDALFYHHGQFSDAWMGIFDLFEFFLSLLSNTVSFVRVGAYALTHGALMLAIFSLQKLANDPISSNLILIGGNLFVIFFEGFIVGIQTLRLEYYEFFVRFFKGSGRLFKPVRVDKE
ncbi:MAG: V-type ATP synthase subunit I [Brevinema sp.]